MDPRLVTIAGPLTGTVLPLEEGETSIGRDPASHLCIPHPSVSRRHCMIERVREECRLVDLGSRHGTYVNGIPVQKRILKTGDRIAISTSLLLFSLDDRCPAPDPGVKFDDANPDPSATIELRPEDAVYLRPDTALETAASDGRAARGLEALLRLSTAINTIRPLDALQESLLRLVLEAVPAQRAAVVLGEDGGEGRSVVSVARHPGRSGDAPISRTICGHVLRTGNAVLSNNVFEEESFRSADSVMGAKVRAVLCVPLQTLDSRRGVLYLDGSDPNGRFDTEQLQLMMGVAGIAAVALQNARHVEWLESETRRLQADLNAADSMVGHSLRMQELSRFIGKVAPTDATVLVRGETGTGKELVARAIHANSRRTDRPFVAVNCAALTETLLESELFGHERGAFTGAVSQKKGRLEMANGGTLFLDEIGEFAPVLQAKLLRVLQEREFERVGSSRSIKVDIRVVAATNRDLEQAVREKAFREDLFYRLNVVAVHLPPLRERRDDIPLLVDHFVARYSEKFGRRIVAVAQEARERLARYDWPGNIRELQNVIERAVVLGSSEVLRLEDLPESLLESHVPAESPMGRYQEAVNELKKQLIVTAMREGGGSTTEAARLLGLHPNYLHRLIRNMNLKPALGK